MRCRTMKRPLFVAAIVFCVAVALIASIPPQGIAGLLELDGNAVVDASGNDDWNLLNGTQIGNPKDTGSAGNSQVRTFVAGPSSPENFTTGGSKDPLDITNWKWTQSSSPDKDTLTNGYAAAYDSNLTNNELILYFGADRFAVNGDSNIGIWFFQDNVAPIAGGKFSGKHTDHDILAVSAFTQGGGISTITVYEWDHTCTGPTFPKNPGNGDCADNNLRVLFTSSTVCGSADACAVVNSSSISVLWPYLAKSGGATIPTGGFYEGGFNVTQLLAAAGVTNLPCFTSFLEETRSSQSTSATLKDFIAGQFPLCGMSVAKECPTCSIVSNGQTFSWDVDGTVTNTGVGALYDVTVVDDAGTPSDTSDDLTFNCGTLSAGQTKKWGAGAGAGDCTDATGHTVTSTTQNPISNGVKASGATSSGGSNKVNASGSAVCGKCTVNPALTVGKSCSTDVAISGTQVAVKVNFSGSVQNTGNEQLTNVAVSEDNNADGSVDVNSLNLTKNGAACGSPCSLNPGDSATFSGSYFPNNFEAVTAGRATFADTVSATAKGKLSGSTVGPNSITAHCLLCPYGACPTTP